MRVKSLDPVVVLLAALMVFFTIVLIYTEHMFKDDGQAFQVVSNVLSGLVGGFLMGIRKELGLPDDSTTVRTATTITTVPAVALAKEPAA